ncbi:unnamed protein product [Arabidopsis lyrata]|uniref:heat stress transcription factor A-4a-like n=1 Tax=Arabidopsis lyrata subsp. lyrata TaxID=81972 RepID=UPI000A29B72C|nr:heat stress transcription factor A-4a-like [Arabidopsis lyrata subsp. lyrata]XP_020889899.1 heat stress transcription factor A-4a-like [Arabidopsis lyrata subsp. lyrata]CAH8258663.1 unnamed protein product [Arabidopsis lyrata]|eukprot:XP_020889898.1 heat stress transcription factor A-4a-like [Arabidopsis lyrata subsp. lyrata]
MLCSFYKTIYKVVDDPSLDPIISWSKSNNSFIVWNLEGLHREVLPKSIEFGKHYLKFMTELKFYGFRRIKGSEQWEFGHEYFVRGQPELLVKMMFKTGMKRIEELAAKRRAKKKKAKAAAKAKADEAEVEDRLQHLRI